MQLQKIRLGRLQVAIIVLTIATALIHLSLLFPDVVFILNGLGYLGLLAVLYVPLAIFANRRGLARVLLMAFTAATIAAWIVMGSRTAIGYIDKIIEIILIILLWLENQRSKVQHIP